MFLSFLVVVFSSSSLSLSYSLSLPPHPPLFQLLLYFSFHLLIPNTKLIPNLIDMNVHEFNWFSFVLISTTMSLSFSLTFTDSQSHIVDQCSDYNNQLSSGPYFHPTNKYETQLIGQASYSMQLYFFSEFLSESLQ